MGLSSGPRILSEAIMSRPSHRAVFRIWLAAIVVTAPSAAVVAQEARRAASPDDAVTLSYATPESFAGVIARPKRVLTAPEMQMLPYEVFQAAGEQEFGIDPLTIEQVQVFVEPPMLGPPQFLAVLRFTEPFTIEQLTEQVTRHTRPENLGGRTYLRSVSQEPSLYAPDDRTLLIGSDDMLRRAYNGREAVASSPLLERLQRLGEEHDAIAAVEFAPIRPLVTAQIQQLPPLPPALEAFRSVPQLIEAAEWSLDVTGEMAFGMTVYATDEQAAEELEVLVLHALELWQQQMLAQLAQAEQSDDAIQQAMARYMKRVSGNMTDIYRPVREENRLVFFGGEEGEPSEQSQQLYQVAVIGILVALLLPAVQAAREAARRNACRNNLRNLGIAMHHYQDNHKSFPPRASYDADGKPLLSWRVHILPYLEEQELYEKFRLDEPWDSEHNKQLIGQMPAFYACPSSPRVLAEHRSSYVAPYGEGLLWDGREGTRIADIRDGTSKTIMLAEVDDDHAPIWTQPQDVEVDRQNPLANLGSYHPRIFIALFGDVHVEEILTDTLPETIWPRFTRAAED